MSMAAQGSPKGRREIAAPYQQTTSSPIKAANGTGAASPARDDTATGGLAANPDGSIDYRSFQFQELEHAHLVAFDKYCGPTPESNWVVPGKLLVGAYPASVDDAETLDLITSILRWGVTKFVCLQQEYREHGVSEQMWRSGQALRPYFHDVRSIVKKKALLPCLRNYAVVDFDALNFVHFPIRDCGVTDDDRVLELARSLVKSIAEGEIIYLHCWGGHGRTGTLVCIMLHLMYGYSDVQAMQYCQAVHDLRQCPVVVGSPQTQTQRDQVSRVIQKLMIQSRYHSRTLSGDDSMLTGGGGDSPRQALQLQGNQTLSSTINSPRADPLASSGNQSTGMASPDADAGTPSEGPEGDGDDNADEDGEEERETTPVGSPVADPAAVMAAMAMAGTPEVTSEQATSEMDDSVTPAPSQRDNGGFSVPHSSPGEGGEGSSMSLDIVGVMEHGAETGTMAVECSLPSAPVVATTTASAEYQLSYTEAEEDDATDGRMRLASDSHIQVDLSALVADTDTDTDTGGAGGYPLNAHNDNGGNLGGVGGDLCGGDEVREAEGAEPVAVHPPAQGKPSFAFSRKGLAGQA